MKKTLYIQIDNNSLPEGCGEDVEVLDCRCINDFCSMVGDALVRDLKDENGKPFYRQINPVGRLLMDFKDVDEKAFNAIAEDWYDILGNLLHKGQQDEYINFKLSQQYVDWLTQNENPYYEQVGKELQKAKGRITLSLETIDDDIIASLNYKVSHTFQENKDNYSFVVFSNPIIRNSSFFVKKGRLDGIKFMRYDSWMEEMKKYIAIPEKFQLDNYIVGMTREENVKGAKIERIKDFPKIGLVFYQDCSLVFDNGVLESISIEKYKNKKSFERIARLFLLDNIDYSSFDYYKICDFLQERSFTIIHNTTPHYDSCGIHVASIVIKLRACKYYLGFSSIHNEPLEFDTICISLI